MLMHPIRIAPSVIAADFGNLGADLARAEKGGADMLHVDIMDGHFVPNITFGPDIVKKIKSLTKLPLDVHLMISHPRQYIPAFAKAGAANITFHVESEDEVSPALHDIILNDCTAGLSVKPGTPLTALRDYLGRLDRILVMTVEPGFGGQKFMPDMMPKVEEAAAWRKQGGFRYDIEVDGGLDNTTIRTAVKAGAEVIVAGTSVFGHHEPAVAIRELRENATSALS
ncbi:MAG: ribulose-phosphate 3-epimerase [Methylacidiphilales bacterium]|nr:ribulose-phosphate 3-epimerase [Candidatus Methylacidiphilales bacterium]